MKKINFILLSILFLSIFTQNVSAKEGMFFKSNSELNYVMTDKNGENAVFARELEKGIYELENGAFLMDTGTEYFQSVDKVELKLTDKRGIEEVKNDYDISNVAYLDLLNASNIAISDNNEKANVVMYLPVRIFSRAASSSKTWYFTYGGKKMKSEAFYYNGCSTGIKRIKTGTGTKNYASTLSKVAISTAGIFNKFLGITTYAASVLGDFYKLFGNHTISGSYQDFYEAGFEYNTAVKYTFVDKGMGYEHAVTSYRSLLLKSYHYQRYFVSGKGLVGSLYSKNHNDAYTSPNWNHPEREAVKFIKFPVVDDFIKIKIGGITLYMTS